MAKNDAGMDIHVDSSTGPRETFLILSTNGDPDKTVTHGSSANIQLESSTSSQEYVKIDQEMKGMGKHNSHLLLRVKG